MEGPTHFWWSFRHVGHRQTWLSLVTIDWAASEINQRTWPPFRPRDDALKFCDDISNGSRVIIIDRPTSRHTNRHDSKQYCPCYTILRGSGSNKYMSSSAQSGETEVPVCPFTFIISPPRFPFLPPSDLLALLPSPLLRSMRPFKSG